jgi:hypothetical protein
MAQPDFTKFAGTLIANGTDAQNKRPMFALEKGAQLAYNEIPGLVDNLMAQMTGIIVNPTQVYANPVSDLFIKSAADLGYGYEETGYGAGAPDKKSDGTCKQIGNVHLPEGVFHARNYASHAVLEIFDKEFKTQTFTPEQVATLVANKIRTIAKTEANKLAMSERQIMSQIVNGTRNITSYINSEDPLSTAAYYPEGGASAAPGNVKGYIGNVQLADITGSVAGVGVGSTPVFTTADAVALLKQIKSTARDMAMPSTDFNKAGREAFVEGKPNMIVAKKVMDALNYALMDGDQHKLGGYSDGATTFLKDAVEIKLVDDFGAMPTNAALTVGDSTIDTDDYNIGVILADPSVFREVTYLEDMESERCMGRRSTIYDYVTEKAIFASTFLPSSAILFEKPSA